MTNLTPSSWVKIVLIALLCLVLCAGVGGCMVGISYSARTTLGLFDSHYYAANDAAFQNAGYAEVSADQVRDLDIDWLAGSVEVISVDDETTGGNIQVQEYLRGDSPDVPERLQMRWSFQGEKLSIVYADGRFFNWDGLTSCSSRNAKRLVVSIPQSYAQNLRVISIAGASGGYSLTNIGCERLSVDLASGNLGATGISADMVDLDIASGKVDIEGVFPGTIKLDEASGESIITCSDVCPANASISLASGNAQLIVPDGSGYSISLDKLSGAFNCPGATAQGEGFVAGDGAATFKVDMMSGNVLIAQNGIAIDAAAAEENASAVPSAPKAPAAPTAPEAPQPSQSS